MCWGEEGGILVGRMGEEKEELEEEKESLVGQGGYKDGWYWIVR